MTKQEYIEKLTKGTAVLTWVPPKEDVERDFTNYENQLADQIAKDFGNPPRIEGLENLNYPKRVKYRCKLWVEKLAKLAKKEQTNVNKLRGLLVLIHNLEDNQVKNVAKRFRLH